MKLELKNMIKPTFTKYYFSSIYLRCFCICYQFISKLNIAVFFPKLSFIIVLFFIPELAFANPITEGVNWVMDLLTNGIARSAAIIGIAILGYLAWFGRITGETCGKYIAGILLVFGGTAIVDMIIIAVS